jgi:broad specificity phosphatase PhoE
MNLIIVRHGETIENATNISMGHIDGTLSELGQSQVVKLGERLKNEKIDFIYCSDLGRTKATLLEITKYHVGVPVIYDEILRERGKGIYEGLPQSVQKSAREIKNIDYFKFRPMDSDKHKGESFEDVKDRASRFAHYLLKNHTENETILVCTHGGWKTSFMHYFMNLPFEGKDFSFNFKNTSVSIFELNQDKNHVIHLINYTKHLEDNTSGDNND